MNTHIRDHASQRPQPHRLFYLARTINGGGNIPNAHELTMLDKCDVLRYGKNARSLMWAASHHMKGTHSLNESRYLTKRQLFILRATPSHTSVGYPPNVLSTYFHSGLPLLTGDHV